eukprot:scaffold76202_cov33-Tisochrysis_lutea.AAC.3
MCIRHLGHEENRVGHFLSLSTGSSLLSLFPDISTEPYVNRAALISGLLITRASRHSLVHILELALADAQLSFKR